MFEEKWSAWGLLLAVIVLNLGNVYVSVRINEWNNVFYNALQKLDGDEFFRQLGVFCVLAALYIIMAVYALYLSQMLQIRWRRWLTREYLGAWLTDNAYYQLELKTATDNPHSRGYMNLVYISFKVLSETHCLEDLNAEN
jgi:putative ATP-binding cassette transporter